MCLVVAGDALLAKSHDEPLAVMGELMNLMRVPIYDPEDVSLGIVGIDLDGVWKAEQVRPLRPLFGHFPVAIDHQNEMAMRAGFAALRGAWAAGIHAATSTSVAR